jgi:hypothetical protein
LPQGVPCSHAEVAELVETSAGRVSHLGPVGVETDSMRKQGESTARRAGIHVRGADSSDVVVAEVFGDEPAVVVRLRDCFGAEEEKALEVGSPSSNNDVDEPLMWPVLTS